jgi:flagellar motor switch protein FliG
MITNLPARSKGLIVLMSLNPEVSTDVCKFLGQNAMNDLIFQLHRLPSETYDYRVRQQVLTEFAQQSGIAIEAGIVDMEAFESTAKNSPEQFANFLKNYAQMDW